MYTLLVLLAAWNFCVCRCNPCQDLHLDQMPATEQLGCCGRVRIMCILSLLSVLCFDKDVRSPLSNSQNWLHGMVKMMCLLLLLLLYVHNDVQVVAAR